MRIIAGSWGGRRLKAPKGTSVRPTSDRVREAWFSAIGGRVDGAAVVDLFGGSGALGLEALSRGARSVVFVERSRPALEALRANISTLGAEAETKIVRGDALRYAGGLGAHAFDLALADPPYDKGFASDLMRLFDTTPFAREFWVEHRSRESLPEIAGATSRRYGDTTLTMLRCADDHE